MEQFHLLKFTFMVRISQSLAKFKEIIEVRLSDVIDQNLVLMKRRTIMKSQTLKGIALALMLASATLLSGCGASNAVKMHIGEVEATANEAMKAANAAEMKAEHAMMMMKEMQEGKMMHEGKMMRKGKKGMMMKYKK